MSCVTEKSLRTRGSKAELSGLGTQPSTTVCFGKTTALRTQTEPKPMTATSGRTCQLRPNSLLKARVTSVTTTGHPTVPATFMY